MPQPMTDAQRELFLLQMFSSRAAREGAVVRRSVADVERALGREGFRQELRRRGYRAVENAGQFIIFCNREQVLAVL